VISEAELVEAVDAAFGVTGRGLVGWGDPHRRREPADEDYSRVTDPDKWRIVGARAEAWCSTMSDLGLAVIQRSAEVRWVEKPGTVISSAERLVPRAAGALPLVVAHSRVGDGVGVGLTLGVGDPAVLLSLSPYCGCDACDGGSQEVLDDLDDHIFGVVSGTFRRLTSGERQITSIGTSTNWSGMPEDLDSRAFLADPAPDGWDQLAGTSWLGG
jgi:hypothetical protein